MRWFTVVRISLTRVTAKLILPGSERNGMSSQKEGGVRRWFYMWPVSFPLVFCILTGYNRLALTLFSSWSSVLWPYPSVLPDKESETHFSILKKKTSVVKSWTETLFFIYIHDLHNSNQWTISNFVCDKRLSYMITLKFFLCLYLFSICHILRNSLVEAHLKETTGLI